MSDRKEEVGDVDASHMFDAICSCGERREYIGDCGNPIRLRACPRCDGPSDVDSRRAHLFEMIAELHTRVR